MRFALTMPNTARVKALSQPFEVGVTGEDQAMVARRAEELGYDMIPIPEHFVVPTSHVELSGPHYLHSTVAQAFIAGATNRIRVLSSVTLLPLQHPVVLAKALSTADWMSNGRITVTFGVGWDAEEFEVIGVPFHRRGRIADEYLRAIIELWTSDEPAFDGAYVSFRDVVFEPKPVQKPHPPIWFGGDADAMLKRVARYGSGWFPWLTKPEDIPAKIDFIKSQPTYDGRPLEVLYGIGTSRIGEGHQVVDDPTQLPGMSADAIIDELCWYAELGVTISGVPIPPVPSVDAYLDYAQWVMEEIKPKVP
ncbi:TIGR03619 family F420-dependent LLM class oxidoreductase [Mycobacterium sp. 1164985.4]|uniref:TIGR03619 family F420-dependent LLM class oxidoreductase n=1 Tax=Mycobacterium sp. 1164985.4 TaxID=1834069 RepID=UPI000800C14E|nr:TIGR03619 family F420-dependent LLM class oxidoreductase [Mycobacterium sp. 1164985.4]OBK76509.1 LLM class F420-dependent oxidoreductase [Mycobacterium sp. 1164985.4]